ncbi:hypothetical protein IV203_023694 [Nitzschia inconspicua]|uniref:Uncharacterized protein n=1 Tax=Nitzschia inconspicua TaxID=303405 RepID=A0A9K3PCK4_9STRA|nr:hypothetical protein IV203_023694 [Nitzschia inconspicua]
MVSLCSLVSVRNRCVVNDVVEIVVDIAETATMNNDMLEVDIQSNHWSECLSCLNPVFGALTIRSSKAWLLQAGIGKGCKSNAAQ